MKDIAEAAQRGENKSEAKVAIDVTSDPNKPFTTVPKEGKVKTDQVPDKSQTYKWKLTKDFHDKKN